MIKKRIHDFIGITIAVVLFISIIVLVKILFPNRVLSESEEKNAIQTISIDEKEKTSIQNSITIVQTNSVADLEMHSPNNKVYSMDQAGHIIQQGYEEYEKNGKKLIETASYISKFTCGEYDSDSYELKSYIYHMMLNSVDYFNSAEGKMVYAMNPAYPADIEFQTDINKGLAYEKESQFNKVVFEEYAEDGKLYSINPSNSTYSEKFYGPKDEFSISDNDRIIKLENGENLTINRQDTTQAGIAGNSCLFPQSYAASHLFDFDKWELGDIVEICGRTCVKIKGIRNDNEFTMSIDVATGSLLNYELYDLSNNVIGYVRVDNISIDNNVDVKRFDNSCYTKEDIQ